MKELSQELWQLHLSCFLFFLLFISLLLEYVCATYFFLKDDEVNCWPNGKTSLSFKRTGSHPCILFLLGRKGKVDKKGSLHSLQYHTFIYLVGSFSNSGDGMTECAKGSKHIVYILRIHDGSTIDCRERKSENS